MKKTFSFLLFFCALSSLVYSQKISVTKIQQITDNTQSEFYYPKLSPNNQKLFFTSSNYAGLWALDLQSKKISQVSKDLGAGYEFTFTEDGQSVIYRINKFNENGLRVSQSIIQKNLSTLQEKVIATGTDLSAPKMLAGQNMAFTSSDALQLKSSIGEVKTNGVVAKTSNISDQPFTCIEHQKIALYINGEKKILAPLGEGNYIWPSVSPDGTKLLFTRAGKGTYVSDLQGNIQANLGYANAPQWSPDGKWILFMKDYDNGTDVTSSDIFAYNLLSSQTTQLTDTKDIHEMYPQWSSDGQKVIFNSADGKIFLMELKAE